MCCSSSLTCSQIQAEVEERAVSQGTQQVVAALERRHQDGARDNFCTHTHTHKHVKCVKSFGTGAESHCQNNSMIHLPRGN